MTAMLVYCSLLTDDGYAGYCRIASTDGSRIISKYWCYDYAHYLYVQAKRLFDNRIQLACKRVKELYRIDQNVAPDADSISDIVAFNCA